jgi:heat shock protein HtpX
MRRTLMGSAPRPDGTVISPESMYRWFGARLLSPAEVPELFAILTKVCSRAGLARLPDLYCLPALGDMNAYALGGPERSALVLTEGLLRGMTREEIAGILAHEVAHIDQILSEVCDFFDVHRAEGTHPGGVHLR